MLECFHYDSYTLDEMKDRWFLTPSTIAETAGGKLTALITESDTDRFRMNQLTVTSDFHLEGQGEFAIAIVLEGSGRLAWGSGELKTGQGDTFFLPASLPAVRWISEGESPLRIVLCYSPRS
jgi:mannose-6-phosphate isomerase